MRNVPPAPLGAWTDGGTDASHASSTRPLGKTADANPPPLHGEAPATGQQPWPLTLDPEQDGHAAGIALPQESSPSKPPRRRSSVFAAISYISLGFVAGAGFWHAVGFWTLVQNAVFSGPRQKLAAPQPFPASRPAAIFNEEELRNFSRRRVAPDRPPISTGSIGAPIPAIAADPQPATMPADDAEQESPGPGGIAWQPAVKPSP